MKQSNRRIYIAIIGLFALVVLGLWLVRHGKRPDSLPATTAFTSATTSRASTPPSRNSLAWNGRPKLFKSQKYPPETSEEKAMWEWWHKMEKEDPHFQWKTPIEFYGQVLDQLGRPVPEAKVTFGWTASGGAQTSETKSDGQGGFGLAGANGKYLQVEVMKSGYQGGKQARKGFEYAAFFEFDYHVPDAAHPVVFRLWKLGDTEPMYQWASSWDVGVDGKPLWINASTGKRSDKGDFSVSIWRSIEQNPHDVPFDLKITIQAAQGGGVVLTKDERMYLAPDSDWQPSVVIERKILPPWYASVEKPKIYLRTPDGKYAALQMSIDQFTKPGAGVQIIGYFNPSGSQNLEFDDKKQIAPPR
ncbi:MAG: carboxypeptidase-like regulatory domain-containing protein [Lacunisphaera sp.]